MLGDRGTPSSGSQLVDSAVKGRTDYAARRDESSRGDSATANNGVPSHVPPRSPTRNPFSATPLTVGLSLGPGIPLRSPGRSSGTGLNFSNENLPIPHSGTTQAPFTSRSSDPGNLSSIHHLDPAPSGGHYSHSLSSSSEIAARAIREDNLAKDRLVLDAQRQVRELLKYKEENSMTRTEIRVLQEKLAAKDDEIAHKQRVGLHDQEEKEHNIHLLQGKLHDVQNSSTVAIQRLEEKLRDALSQNLQFRREIESKDSRVLALESELAGVKRQLVQEKDRVEEHQQNLARLREQLIAQEAKHEESVRNAVKADATRSALMTQLREKDQALESLRNDYDHLKKKKSELLVSQTEVEAQKAALQARVTELKQELDIVPKLKLEISTLLASREELGSLRHVMEESEMAMASERSYRRTLELDKEQLQLKISSLHEDLSHAERELHQAQVDAAEKVSLRRELNERVSALEVSQNLAQQLQHQIIEMKESHHREAHDREQAEAFLTQRVAILRRSAESALHDIEPSPIAFAPYEKEGKADLFAASVLAPLETALRDLVLTAADLRKSNSSLQRSLSGDRATIAGLETELRETNLLLTQQQIRNEKLQSALKEAEGKVTDLSTQHASAVTTASENLAMLGITFGIHGASWEAVQQAASRTLQSANQYRQQTERLTVSLEETQEKGASDRAEAKKQFEDTVKSFETRIKDLNLQHALEMNQASETQRSLNEALTTALKRHEETKADLATVQRNCSEAMQSLNETQKTLNVTKGLLDDSRGKIVELDHKCEALHDENERLQSILAEEVKNHKETRLQLAKVSEEALRLGERLSGFHDALKVCVRGILGLRQAHRGAIEQRNVLIQYVRVQDLALQQIQSEAPLPVKKPRPTLRVAVIAVLVANRLKKALRLQRARKSVSFGDSMGARLRETVLTGSPEKLQFPPIKALQEKQLVLPTPTDQPGVALQSIVSQFEEEVASPTRRGKEPTLFQCITSSSFRARLSPQGPTALAKAISNAYAQKLKLMDQEVRGKEEVVVQLRRQATDLKNQVQLKEDESKRYQSRVDQLVSEREAMIDRRTHESVTNELRRTKTELERFAAEKRTLESRYGELQNRELDLLSKHTALQTEARSLALELARTGSSVNRSQLMSRRSGSALSNQVSVGQSWLPAVNIPEVQSSPSTPRSDALGVSSQYAPLTTVQLGNAASPRTRSSAFENPASPLGAVPVSLSSTAAQPPQEVSTLSQSSANSTYDLLKMIKNIDSKISGALRNQS